MSLCTCSSILKEDDVKPKAIRFGRARKIRIRNTNPKLMCCCTRKNNECQVGSAVPTTEENNSFLNKHNAWSLVTRQQLATPRITRLTSVEIVLHWSPGKTQLWRTRKLKLFSKIYLHIKRKRMWHKCCHLRVHYSPVLCFLCSLWDLPGLHHQNLMLSQVCNAQKQACSSKVREI